jgi:PiT family inorganic phosphate transporter
MPPLMYVIIGAVALALIFDVINGFHDAANSIATVVSTRVLSPQVAILWAGFFNFVAMFVFAPRVADTIAKIVRIDGTDTAYVYVVLCGLLGAIVWDLITWWLGLPTSSSHALIGGVAGAGLAYKGMEVIRWEHIWKAVKFIPLAPALGLVLASAATIAVSWIFRRWRPASVDHFFRRGQLLSASLYSLGHGGNDAQKTMGIIMALMIAGGLMKPDTQLSLSHWNTLWIILSCHLAMGIGTAMGGWRIVKTMGMRLTKLKPFGGFCAETGGSAAIFLATALGVPVSTTHTITGGILGVGAVNRPGSVRWGVAARIIWAWVFTIPMSALIAVVAYWILRLF